MDIFPGAFMERIMKTFSDGSHNGMKFLRSLKIKYTDSASFVLDAGITDPRAKMYGPVVSTTPGPIVVWDVEIVG